MKNQPTFLTARFFILLLYVHTRDARMKRLLKTANCHTSVVYGIVLRKSPIQGTEEENDEQDSQRRDYEQVYQSNSIRGYDLSLHTRLSSSFCTWTFCFSAPKFVPFVRKKLFQHYYSIKKTNEIYVQCWINCVCGEDIKPIIVFILSEEL